eukprot:SM000004S15029  [mRNA]  locus=s4:840845:842424:- [translate_table: standard]
MAALKHAVLLVLVAAASTASAQQCPPANGVCAAGSGCYGSDCSNYCVCLHGSTCFDGPAGNGTCNCNKTTDPGHFAGGFCSNCADNYDFSTGCTTVIDPCLATPYQAAKTCPIHSTCTFQNAGNATCECDAGYEYSSFFKTCVPILYCFKFPPVCPILSYCTQSVIGAFNCTCFPTLHPVGPNQAPGQVGKCCFQGQTTCNYSYPKFP